MARIPEPARAARAAPSRGRPAEDAPSPPRRPAARPAGKKSLAEPAGRAKAPARAAKPAKSVTEGLRPIKERQTQAEMIDELAARASEVAGTEFSRRDVKAFLQAQSEYLVRCTMPRGVGECTVLPGFVRVSVKHYDAVRVPARKAGEYPGFGGEMRYHEARPAHTKPAVDKPRCRPGAKLKAAVLGE